MKTVHKYFLEAIRAYFNKEKLNWEQSGEKDRLFWDELFSLAYHQKVFPMIFETVCSCDAFTVFPESEASEFKMDVFKGMAIVNRKRQFFLGLYKGMCERRIHSLVVKGIICQQMYEKPECRVSSDEDIFVDKKDAFICHDYLIKHGFVTVWSAKGIIPNEVTYTNDRYAMILEIHYELFPVESNVYGVWNQFFVGCIKDRMVQVIDGYKVYTMQPTKHLLYLICHAFKHFLHSGFGIRQICDICLYIMNYAKEIHWDEIDRRICEISAEGFFNGILGIGKYYLGMDAKKAIIDSIRKNENIYNWLKRQINPEPLAEDVLDGGIYGDSTMARKHSSTMTLAAVDYNKNKKKIGLSVLKSIFPSKVYMATNYPYVEQHHFLLPVAWVQRVIDYRKETRGERKDNQAKKSMEIGNQRIQLLKKYKVIEKHSG